MVFDFNTSTKSHKDITLHELFEIQVQKTPNNIAVVYENIQLTYNELNLWVNRLANYLQANSTITGDDLIVLCLKRNQYMVIAILAVLKAGGAYVAIDPHSPQEWLNHIVQDTKSKVILTNLVHQDNLKQIKLNELTPQILAIDNTNLFNELEIYSIEKPSTNLTKRNLAYVMYTSGTTGTPKGVMIEHHSVIAKLNYLIKQHKIDSNYNILSKTSYNFDPSVREIFLALLTGSKLIIADETSSKDVNLLVELCIRDKIHLIVFVPSHLTLFAKALNNLDHNKLAQIKLKLLYSCGEKLSNKLILDIQKILPNLKIKNQYGPTEACMFTCEYNIEINSQQFTTQIPIGLPIDDTYIYILDDNLLPVPNGMTGELYIGGNGLARGYLNLPELTDERFIASPFIDSKQWIPTVVYPRLRSGTGMTTKSAEMTYMSPHTETNDSITDHPSVIPDINEQIYKESPGSRLYKTGDLVRRLADGNLEYIGRNDFQIKMNGYRIEPREIEVYLETYPEVRQAVVLVLEHPIEDNYNKYLIAYYVAPTRLDDVAIMNYLSTRLPRYMLPSTIIYLEQFPLTTNGKLDRSALPYPKIGNIGNNYIEPRTKLEQELCQIYAEVLGLKPESVGIEDDFFKLGGNSILAINLVNKIRSKLNYNITLFDIFAKKSILSLINPTKSDIQDTIQYYSLKSNEINTLKTIFIMIPGPEQNFEKAYIKLSQHLHEIYPSEIYILKSNFIEHNNINDIAMYYAQIIENLAIDKNKQLILLGFSSGGEIAYFIAKLLEKHYTLKLVLFDSWFNHNNYYFKLRNLVRSVLHLPPVAFSIWHHNVTATIVPILYFQAMDKKMTIVNPAAKLRLIRQIKCNIEYIFYKCSKLYKLPNGLKSYMQISKIIRINCEHAGEHGMLNKHVPKIVTEVVNWLG